MLDCEPRLPERDSRSIVRPSLPFMDLAKLRRAAVRQALQMTGGHKGRAANCLACTQHDDPAAGANGRGRRRAVANRLFLPSRVYFTNRVFNYPPQPEVIGCRFLPLGMQPTCRCATISYSVELQ